jgi:uncharacterized membrane protein (DUF373 family)
MIHCRLTLKEEYLHIWIWVKMICHALSMLFSSFLNAFLIHDLFDSLSTYIKENLLNVKIDTIAFHSFKKKERLFVL